MPTRTSTEWSTPRGRERARPAARSTFSPPPRVRRSPCSKLANSLPAQGARRDAKVIVFGKVFLYIARAMQEFHPAEWCFDPYAKQCDRCDVVIGRYAVMTDEHGFRNVLFWAHTEWDG